MQNKKAFCHDLHSNGADFPLSAQIQKANRLSPDNGLFQPCIPLQTKAGQQKTAPAVTT